MMVHALSFDVENWYDGNIYDFTGRPDDRVVGEMTRLLAVLAAAKVTATFFILGSVAERHPSIVRSVAAAGHEVACHGFGHERIFRLTPALLEADLLRSRALLQDLSGQPVMGYRAPSWSLQDGALQWAPEVIKVAGFRYSSSVFPMRTPYYGVPGTPNVPWNHGLLGGRVLPELPPAVARMGPARVPFGGGIYWRLLPDWAINQLLRWHRTPAILYLHPWELNPERAPAGNGVHWAARPILTIGVAHTERTLRRTMQSFSFGRIDQVFANHIAQGVEGWAGSLESDAAVTYP